jgi:hypothetical protein
VIAAIGLVGVRKQADSSPLPSANYGKQHDTPSGEFGLSANYARLR